MNDRINVTQKNNCATETKCTIAEALERIKTPHLVLIAGHLLTLLSPELAQSIRLMGENEDETLVHRVLLEVAYQIIQEDTPATCNLYMLVEIATNQLTHNWGYVDTDEKFIYELCTNIEFVHVVIRMQKCSGGSPLSNLFEEIVDALLRILNINGRNERLYRYAIGVICSVTQAPFQIEKLEKYYLTFHSQPVSVIDWREDWFGKPAPF